jgi:hypothetical protein
VGRKVREFETPGYSGKVLEKSTDEDVNIAETMFLSLLGRIQYFQGGSRLGLERARLPATRVRYSSD